MTHLHVLCGECVESPTGWTNLRQLTTEGHDRFVTGVWYLRGRMLEGARHAEYIWLHPAQAANAVHGGRIVERRQSVWDDAPDRQPRRLDHRWTFIFVATPDRCATIGPPLWVNGFAATALSGE